MFVPDPTPDNHIVTTFTAEGAKTLLTVTMTLPDVEVRKALLESGMEFGMEASYARLEQVSGWKTATTDGAANP